MREPKWVSSAVVMAVHEAQTAEHGGMAGVRQQELLESALARPRQIYAYADEPSLVKLAAGYAFGIGRNRAFLDGNKRTAWVICALFLELNGSRVTTSQTEVVAIMLGVADGSLSEESFVEWLERNSR